MDKAKKFASITDNLNKLLQKSLDNFGTQTQWTDIHKWLSNVQVVLRDNNSPFITQKILLSKRLSQCLNPGLPQKTREVVIRIHALIFMNMRTSVEGNINQYIRLFAEDLGVYSMSLLPYFAHSEITEHRMMILDLISNFYFDLGKQLIPMLTGLMVSVLPVYEQTNDQRLNLKIENILMGILQVVGRKYVVGSIWSSILKFTDCRASGLIFLSKIIARMEFIKGEEEFSQSHGFSEEEEQLKRELMSEEQKKRRSRTMSLINTHGNIVSSNQNTPQIKQQELAQSPEVIVRTPPQTPIKTLRSDKEEEQLVEKVQTILQLNNEKKQNHQDKNNNQNKEIKQTKDIKDVKDIKQTNVKDVKQANVKDVKDLKDVKDAKDVKDIKQKNLTDNLPKELKQKKGLENFVIKQEQNQSENQSLISKTPINQIKQMKQNEHPQNKSPSLTSLIKNQPQKSKLTVPPLDKVPFMPTPGIESIMQGIDNNDNQNNYPNAHTLVVSALITCLEDDQPIIKRAALDFMFSHLRLKSHVLTDLDRNILVEGVLRLFRKKEISICKRVNRWLFGKQDQENKFQIHEKNEFVIPLVVEGLRQILSAQPTNQQNCTLPLKILQNFYIEHPQLVQKTLNKVALNLLRYIFNYEKGYDFSSEVEKSGQRFLQNLPSHYPVILNSFGQIYLQGIETNDSHKCFEIVKYMDHTFIRLMKHEHGIEQLTYLTSLLDHLAIGMEMISKKQTFYCSYMKDASLLILNLCKRREGVVKKIFSTQQKVNQQFLSNGAQQLPIQRINYQNSLRQEIKKKQILYVKILSNIEAFFIRLGLVIRSTPNVTVYEDTFRLISQAIIYLQKCLPKDMEVKELPKWFQTIESGIRVSNPSISLSAIDAMIACMMFENDGNKNQNQFFTSFKNLIVLEKTKKNSSDYQKLALQKLWSLLDFPHMHAKIIDLIVNFSKYFPNQFTETVKKSFMTHNVPEKQASIQRFSHFWRLTGFKYKDLLINNQEFVELNKVGLFVMLDFLDDQNPLVRHAAKNWLMQSMGLFYRVLQPLFNELMKACKGWYVTPKGICLFQRIYDTKIIFDTFRRIRSILSNGSYAFLRYIFQSQISDSIDQMKEGVTDISFPVITEDIKDLQKNKQPLNNLEDREPVLPKNIQNQMIKQQVFVPKKITYMDLLVILCVKYVEGQSIQSMGIQFYIGNSGVNTSAIELIQSLFNSIDSPIISHRLINFILDPLFKVLSQVVLNKEYIIQIQLLNLFKTIMSTSNAFRKKGQLTEVRGFFKTVFTNQYFISSLLKGLNTPFSYVRSQFIDFITSCIPLIADFLDPEDCTRCIKLILITYHKIIKEIKISLVEEVLAEQQDRTDKVNHASLSRILELEMKAHQEEKMIRLTNNLQEVAKTNEILSVLQGVSAILNYFYDLKEFEVSSLKFEFTNPYTILDTFRTIITLGLSSAEKDGKLVSKTNFLHNLDTCQSILKDLSPVYQTILRAWPLSQQFVRIATQDFSSIGMKIFNFERFSRYNRVVKDLIEYVIDEKQSIWGRIYLIMQPMFYKFPSQITDIYLKLWVNECPDAQPDGTVRPNVQKTQFLMKIVETVIVNNFPINVMIHAILQTSTVATLKNYYQRKGVNSQKGIILDYNISCTQSKVLYFIYVYFNYVYLDQKCLTKDKLLQIWSNILKSLKPFLKSKTPQTVLWILEIINLCSRKYSPKQLLTIQKFKSDLHELIKDKIKFLANTASRKVIFFYEQPTKIGFDDPLTQKFKTIVPIPPCLYQIYRKRNKDLNETDQILFKTIKPGDNVEMDRRIRLIAFKALKKIGLQLLQNTYLPQKNQWVIVRTTEWMEIILPVIEDKNPENQLFAQSASQVLYDLLEKARVLFIKSLRPSIIRIFNKDDFFICNINTLNYWAKIIDWVVSIDKSMETFTEYLQKVSLSNSYFTNANAEDKRRIKSFERICFILYSGCIDRYVSRINGLLEKIAQVIRKAEGTHPSLLILILFSVRILILRLSQASLKKLFTDIWPMLLALLMQLFTKNLVKVEMANQISKNPNLLLAGLKLLEMISFFNLLQFSYHQWIFIFDYFGIKIIITETPQLQLFLSKKPQLIEELKVLRTEKEPPFIYVPYLSNYFPHYSVEYIPQKSKEIISYKPKKRKIVIQDCFINDENQLKVRAIALAQYMANLREFRAEINPAEVENIIINDFINLDSFIHRA